MAKKSTHPDKELFDYLNGVTNEGARQQVEQHLAACADCTAVADLVRGLKDSVNDSREQASSSAKFATAYASSLADEHPDVAALASFFYNQSPHKRDAQVAAHVAQCRHCAAEVMLYAEAERAATEYQPAAAESAAIPAVAWGLISEWEESAFAQPKLASEVVNHELLARLTSALREQASPLQAEQDAVPVTVVDREGQVRSVEMFKPATDAEGTSVLRHAEASEQFDAKPVHVLLDFGDENHVILSERIERDTLRVKQPVRQTKPLRADYFIIED